MSKELAELNLAAQIREAYEESVKLAEEAKGHASNAVAKAIECGTLLLRQKESLGHGSWLGWLDENLPEICDRTARRYIGLAKAVGKLDTGVSNLKKNKVIGKCETEASFLTDGSTLRQAYIATGILPKPQPKELTPEQIRDKPWVRYCRFLDGFRLWYNRRINQDPLKTWNPDARRILKKELQWFVNLYNEL